MPAERFDAPGVDVDFPDPPVRRRRPDGRALVGDRRGHRRLGLGRARDAAQRRTRPASPCSGSASAGSCSPRRWAGGRAGRPTPRSAGRRVETDEPRLVPAGPWFQWHEDRWTAARRRSRARPDGRGARRRSSSAARSPCSSTPSSRPRSSRAGWPTAGRAYLAAHGTGRRSAAGPHPQGGARGCRARPRTRRRLPRPASRPQRPRITRRGTRAVPNDAGDEPGEERSRCRSCSASSRR